ncbi:MAG: D-aminoacylase, partial [Pseudomonadota bacterium]|nr:D-aminoacylase [Pseudomonadota bacterium]
MEEIPSLIIRNGTVIDGSGSQRYEADIEITGSKITHIGESHKKGKCEIDASNRIVTPGFVDI